jgi:hypothetical protein
MSWERDRGHVHETEHARHEEAAFKAAARRNRLLAEWAAHLMGLRHRDTQNYVEHLVTGDVAHARGHAIIDRVTRDLHAAGAPTPREVVAAKFVQLETQAHAELAAQDTRGV